MKKKLVTILCVTTITASMLAGCGSKTAETTAPSYRSGNNRGSF